VVENFERNRLAAAVNLAEIKVFETPEREYSRKGRLGHVSTQHQTSKVRQRAKLPNSSSRNRIRTRDFKGIDAGKPRDLGKIGFFQVGRRKTNARYVPRSISLRNSGFQVLMKSRIHLPTAPDRVTGVVRAP
jgi:hypothetical protein